MEENNKQIQSSYLFCFVDCFLAFRTFIENNPSSSLIKKIKNYNNVYNSDRKIDDNYNNNNNNNNDYWDNSVLFYSTSFL